MNRWLRCSALLLLGLAVGTLHAAPPATAPTNTAPPSWQVPYRLLPTKHIMVRAKINGHGPYNFIVDSGAPYIVVAESVCKEAGITPNAQHEGLADKFQIEGGPNLAKTTLVSNDMFQTEGMNALGISGVKLSGSIGYSLLSHYKLEFDFTSDTMTWTELPYTPTAITPFELPPAPGEKPVRAKGTNLEWVGGVTKFVALFVGHPIESATPRGSIGIELADTDIGVKITRILPNTPAAKANLQVGDTLTAISGRSVKRIAEILQLTAATPAGKAIELTLLRNGLLTSLTITTAEGL